jgi:iron complex transport system substrate-binding protein
MARKDKIKKGTNWPLCAVLMFSMIVCLSALIASPAEAVRIVSLYPGHTDNIVALGLGDSIVAVSQNDDWDSTSGASSTSKLPARATPEAILALKPDIVFTRSLNERAEPNRQSILERAGIAVYAIEPPSWNGFEDYLAQLSDILGIDPEETRRKFREIIANVRDRAARHEGNPPRVFLEATSKELRTCAPDSWAASLIELAGGANAASDAKPLREGSPLASWGVERTVALAKSGLDIYLVQQGAMNTATMEEIMRRPWSDALGSVRIEFIPERYLSRPSLLGIEKGSAMLIEMFRGPGSK